MIGYPLLEKGLYDKEGEMPTLPLVVAPGESIAFSLHVGLWIDQRVYDYSVSQFGKPEPMLIEKLREKLLLSHGIDFFGNDMTQRYMYLLRGKAILYPEKGFEDRKIEIQFVTARQNTFIGYGGWYDYEAIKKQNVGEDRFKVMSKMHRLKERMPNKKIQPTPKNGAAD